MKLYLKSYLVLLFVTLLVSCKDEPIVEEPLEILRLQSARVGIVDLKNSETVSQAPIDKNVVLTFSNSLEKSSAESNINLTDPDGNTIPLEFTYLNDNKSISASTPDDLKRNTVYTITIGIIKSVDNEEYPGDTFQFQTVQGTFNLTSATIDGENLNSSVRIQNISSRPTTILEFTDAIDSESLEDFVSIKNNSTPLPIAFELSNENRTLTLTSSQDTRSLTKYTLNISNSLESVSGLSFNGFSKDFYTQLDSTYKFPEISDEALLTLVQEQTFKYFWDFAHPNSGLARERNTSGDIVTIGGSGFGVMAILVGVQRNFITRQQAVDRLNTIVNFLESADRFHGVWPHWMNGNTGTTIPFSTLDNGADFVETAFMIQGLLTARQFLHESAPLELEIINKITALWEAVEWDWFQQEGENVLTWHWSPNFGFDLNLKIRGWNEALIIYTLAASSPTFPISKEVYEQGWAQSGGMINGNSFYDVQLPLGEERGGPLFFAHYSFLGMDPRNLVDQYANYMDQNTAHSLINQAYCISNPQNYVGYGQNAWGLTASDNQDGYSAHSPNNDLGVITPTAAISSIPYTPEESMAAIKHFYYLMGDKLWGEYGFHDAYNVTENWYADSYLAIDQGPIIIMIENYRTGFIWDLYMADPEIQAGLTELGFTY